MSIPAWPTAQLPNRLLLSGYGEAPADVLLRSQMDMGPAKQRRRGTAGARPITGRQVLTSTQLTDFLTFFNTTLLNGSLRFSWVEPRDGVTAVEMRFTEVPTWTKLSKTLFDVQMKLEVLP